MNKNVKIILVLSAVLIAVILAGCVQEKVVPSAPIEVYLAISNAPALNQTAELTCTITSHEDAPNTTAQIKLPEGFELISGDLKWKGDLEKNSQKSFKATVKSVKTGNWAIEAIAETKLKDGESYSVVDYIYVVLGNVTASVSKTPPPTPFPAENEVLVRVFVEIDEPPSTDYIHEPLSGVPKYAGVYKFYFKDKCPGCGVFEKIDEIPLKKLRESLFYGEKRVRGINATISEPPSWKDISFCVGYPSTNFIDEDTCAKIDQSKEEWNITVHYWKTTVAIP